MDDIRLLSIPEARAVLQRLDRFVLTTHTNPDGDALGSEYALAHALRTAGKTVTVINCDPVPSNLAYLNTDALYQVYDPAIHDGTIADAGAIVVVDLNDVSRIRQMAPSVRASEAHKLVVDHHLDPRAFADGYLLDQRACATAEILFALFEDWLPLDESIATGLYTGIMTDTGSFRFERTTPRVHRIAALLLEAGVNPTLIYRRVYDEYPVGRSLLLGRVLAGMQTVCNGKATILRVSQRDLEETGCTPPDLDSVVNYGLGIRGVEATVMITEMPDCVKLNFRSRGSTSVHALAQAFGGGGHRFAAGATVNGATVNEVHARLLEALPSIVANGKG
jgi:phosphoesterase RecJ-like protein